MSNVIQINPTFARPITLEPARGVPVTLTLVEGIPGPKPDYQLDAENDLIRWQRTDGTWGPWLDIGSARKAAQQAADATSEDRAATSADRVAAEVAADNAVSQAQVPIFPTVAGLANLTIPAGLAVLRTNGYATEGDGGGWLAREVANTGQLQPWQALSNGGARRWGLASESITPFMFGAIKGNQAATNAAIANAESFLNSKGGGSLFFPGSGWVFTYTTPPANVSREFDGVTTRVQMGGSAGIEAQNAEFGVLPGPHTDHQKHLRFIRALAKGSGAIGAQYGDYGLGLEIHKEFWSETQGTPVAGEIDGLTINYRNGGPKVGEPLGGISSGAAILANVGATDKSGATQVLEAVNSVFNPSGLAVTRQIGVQVNMLNTRDDDYYGLVLLSNMGVQDAALSARAYNGSRWGRLIESSLGAITPYYMTDNGSQRWQSETNTALGIREDFDAATASLSFKTQDGTRELGVFTQSGFRHRVPVNTQNGAAYTLTDADCGQLILVTQANAVVTLPSNLTLGFNCKVLSRDGQVSFATQAGAIALRNVDGHTKTKGAYAMVELTVAAVGSSAVWYLSGSTAA